MMQPDQPDHAQPPTKPLKIEDTEKHFPRAPNTAETEDSDQLRSVSQVHHLVQPGEKIDHY
jgi:hypothetical protein